MKLGYAKWGSRAPSRLKIGHDYIFENGFTLTKSKYGQHTLKFGTSMVVFHRRLVPRERIGVWGPRPNNVEYLFFKGPEEPVRFRKLKEALAYAADIVAAKDAALRLRGDGPQEIEL